MRYAHEVTFAVGLDRTVDVLMRAARTAALETAANLCDSRGATGCAAAIRALKSEEAA